MLLYFLVSFCFHFFFFLCIDEMWFCLRAEFTKYVVTPAIGVSGVGGAMAVYGAFDGIVSLRNVELKSLPLMVV